MTGILHEDQYIFLTISRSVLFRMRNVSDKNCRENQHTLFIFIVALFTDMLPQHLTHSLPAI